MQSLIRARIASRVPISAYQCKLAVRYAPHNLAAARTLHTPVPLRGHGYKNIEGQPGIVEVDNGDGAILVDRRALREAVAAPPVIQDPSTKSERTALVPVLENAIQHPIYGYYQSAHVFGRGGDFVTSPELGSLFGEMLTLWVLTTWESLGRPKHFNLVEYGPGRGSLMKTILQCSKQFPEFHKAVHVSLIENSPLMRVRQRKSIGVMRIKAEGGASPHQVPSGPVEAGAPDLAAAVASADLSVFEAKARASETRVQAEPAAGTPRRRRTPGAISLDEPESAPVVEPTPAASSSSTSGATGVKLTNEFDPKSEASKPVSGARGRPDEGISEAEIDQMGEQTVEGSTLDGVRVSWLWGINELNKDGPVIVLGHEFLDALPVHQFQYTTHGWRERVVDIESDPTGPHYFRFALSNAMTAAAAVYLRAGTQAAEATASIRPNREALRTVRRQQQHEEAGRPMLLPGNANYEPAAPVATPDIGDGFEFCPGSLAVVQEICARLDTQGGAALLIDYGSDKPVASSLVGIRKHEFVSVLSAPGEVDLSAHVDFSALRRTVEDMNKRVGKPGRLRAFPLITQRELLRELGLGPRVEELLQKPGATEQECQNLLAVFNRLVGTEDGQMGKVYKAFCFATTDAPAPVGFAIPPLESLE